MRAPVTLRDSIHVFTSGLFQTTSVVLEGPDSTLVVDPNYLPEEIETIAAFAASLELPVRVLYTHHHFDHIVGGQAFPDAEILGHVSLPACAAGGPGKPSSEKRVLDFDDEFYVRRDPFFEFVEPTRLLKDGEAPDKCAPSRVALHHPGHSADMLALHLKEQKVLLSADMLSPVEIPMLDGDGTVYLESLEKIRAMLSRGEVSTLVPGHGPIVDGTARILELLKEDVEYIEALRRAAVKAGPDAPPGRVGGNIPYRFKESSPQMKKIHERNVGMVLKGLRG